MRTRQTREYVLELDVESDPIEGRLRDGSQALDFTGWLGLAAAIERMISAHGMSGERVQHASEAEN